MWQDFALAIDFVLNRITLCEMKRILTSQITLSIGLTIGSDVSSTSQRAPGKPSKQVANYQNPVVPKASAKKIYNAKNQ